MKKLLCLLLAALMCVSLFACDFGTDKEEDVEVEETEKEDEKDEDKDKDKEEDKKVEIEKKKIFTEKIGSISYKNFTVVEGGIIYKEDGKYGIATFDGKSETGAIYTFCEPCGKNFTVSRTKMYDGYEVADVNTCGLVDVRGNFIIPETKHSFDSLNDRYVRVFTTTKRTFDDSNYLLTVTATENGVTSTYRYDGEWKVYDLRRESYVSGIGGSNRASVYAYGDYIMVAFDTYDADGKLLPSDSYVFTDGSVRTIIDGKGVVMGVDGKTMFEWDIDGYKPIKFTNGYYIASKRTGSNDEYVVLDANGNTVADKNVAQQSVVYGKVIYTNKCIYDFAGNEIFSDKEIPSIYWDESITKCFAVKGTLDLLLISNNGEVIFESDNEFGMNTNGTTVYKETDSGNLYYSHKDGDFTIAGKNTIVPGCVMADYSNGVYDLVDTFTGDIVLENYIKYDYAEDAGEYGYIYALDATGETYEIFEIK